MGTSFLKPYIDSVIYQCGTLRNIVNLRYHLAYLRGSSLLDELNSNKVNKVKYEF